MVCSYQETSLVFCVVFVGDWGHLLYPLTPVLSRPLCSRLVSPLHRFEQQRLTLVSCGLELDQRPEVWQWQPAALSTDLCLAGSLVKARKIRAAGRRSHAFTHPRHVVQIISPTTCRQLQQHLPIPRHTNGAWMEAEKDDWWVQPPKITLVRLQTEFRTCTTVSIS